jgi:hypothetical protein
MANTFIILIACSMFVTTLANAAAIGLPDSTARIGYGLGIGHISVDDPKGDSDTKWSPLPLNLIYTDWLTSDIRYWTEVFYYDSSLDAGTDKIGQNINHYGIRFSLQKSLRISPMWAPWFGAGLGFSHANYTDRHIIDNDGYLVESYPDREESLVALILNITNEWPVQHNWTIGAKLEQSIPVDNKLADFMATLIFVYRY